MAAQGDIRELLGRSAEDVNADLRAWLGASGGAPPRLVEAMRYSLEAGGKRIRPVLVLWCCDACGGERHTAMPLAIAVECVHTFSLIHDDLPALDNDDLRRGRPASHKQFGEAMAILAGDGLLALAFEVLSHGVRDPELAIAAVRELANATGWQGMIGGEAADIEGESLPADLEHVARIHAAKTARLFEASCRLGAMAAGADDSKISALGAYGRAFGLAFQAADDLLDVTADQGAVGKGTRKDAVASKQTYPRCVGIEETRKHIAAAVEQAVAAVSVFGEKAWKLASLAQAATSQAR